LVFMPTVESNKLGINKLEFEDLTGRVQVEKNDS